MLYELCGIELALSVLYVVVVVEMSFSVLYGWCGEDCSEVTEDDGVELAVESVEFGISELYVVVGYVVTFVLT